MAKNVITIHSDVVTGPQIYEKLRQERQEDLRNFQRRPEDEKSDAVKGMLHTKAIERDIKEWTVINDDGQKEQDSTFTETYLDSKTGQNPGGCSLF